MADPTPIEEIIAGILQVSTRNTLETLPECTVADILAAKQKVTRVLICHPSIREAMQAEIDAADLTDLVKIIVSRECEPGVAYVARTLPWN